MSEQSTNVQQKNGKQISEAHNMSNGTQYQHTIRVHVDVYVRYNSGTMRQQKTKKENEKRRKKTKKVNFCMQTM